MHGGPGTGKSATTIALIQKLRSKGLNVLVAATTSNAAQQLASYYPADTIDAVMYLQPGRTLKALMPGSRARLQLEAADVVICDESSMLTSMKLLLIKYRMRMCTKQGDQAQLPPILLHFMICHSNKCHRPRTSSCHKEQRGGTEYG